MPISWQMNARWIDVTFSDPYTLAESETAMKQIFSHPGLMRPPRFLIDVRHSATPNTDFVGNAITFWQLHVDKMWGAKVAIITGSDSQARMAHISELTAESRELPFTLRVFDQSETAHAQHWLELDTDLTPAQ
jgi:hypothetical protein